MRKRISWKILLGRCLQFSKPNQVHSCLVRDKQIRAIWLSVRNHRSQVGLLAWKYCPTLNEGEAGPKEM